MPRGGHPRSPARARYGVGPACAETSRQREGGASRQRCATIRCSSARSAVSSAAKSPAIHHASSARSSSPTRGPGGHAERHDVGAAERETRRLPALGEGVGDRARPGPRAHRPSAPRPSARARGRPPHRRRRDRPWPRARAMPGQCRACAGPRATSLACSSLERRRRSRSRSASSGSSTASAASRRMASPARPSPASSGGKAGEQPRPRRGGQHVARAPRSPAWHGRAPARAAPPAGAASPGARAPPTAAPALRARRRRRRGPPRRAGLRRTRPSAGRSAGCAGSPRGCAAAPRR